jgi:hypothetical protein
MKHVLDAIEQASHAAAVQAQADLRAAALASNWAPEVADSISVSYDGSVMSAVVPEEHATEAFDYEYGTPKSRPTSVLLKYSNNPTGAESAFVKSLNDILGGKF